MRSAFDTARSRLEEGEESRSASGPPPRIKLRIESLSDLVFGLALSIGALILAGSLPSNGSVLAIRVIEFGFGFLIVIMTWLGYSRIMAVLPVEVPFALVANILLLFLVVLEPYLLYVLFSAQTDALASTFSIAYGLDVGGLFFMQALLAYLVLKEAGSGEHGQASLHPVVLKRFKRIARADAVIAIVFVVSTLPIFWIDTPIDTSDSRCGTLPSSSCSPLYRFEGVTREQRLERQSNDIGYTISIYRIWPTSRGRWVCGAACTLETTSRTRSTS